MCGCLSRGPHWGPGPQPRHVPWLGIELATLWFAAHTQSTELHQPGQRFSNFYCNFFFGSWLFRSVLLNFQAQGCFWLSFSLISSLISLYLENICCMVSVLSNMLRLGLWKQTKYDWKAKNVWLDKKQNPPVCCL